MQNGSQVLAGPFHPAFRQLVEGEIWYDAISDKIKNLNNKVKKVQVTISPESFNYAIGHKRCNVKRIKDLYDVDIVVKSNDEFKPGKFEVEVIKE